MSGTPPDAQVTGVEKLGILFGVVSNIVALTLLIINLLDVGTYNIFVGTGAAIGTGITGIGTAAGTACVRCTGSITGIACPVRTTSADKKINAIFLSLIKMATEQKFALLIGINYIGTENELKGCINDVDDVRQLLITHAGYPSGNILTLTDLTSIKPTTAVIRAGLTWLLSGQSADKFNPGIINMPKMALGTKLFYHYSGHGIQIPDRNKDERDGLDEVMLPLDFKTSGGISDDELRANFLAKIPAGVKLSGLQDCCHSGTAFDMAWISKMEKNKTMSIVRDGTYTDLLGDIRILSACADNQKATDMPIGGRSRGLLSASFITTYKKDIRSKELLPLVQAQMIANGITDQTPQLCFSNIEAVTLNGTFL